MLSRCFFYPLFLLVLPALYIYIHSSIPPCIIRTYTRNATLLWSGFWVFQVLLWVRLLFHSYWAFRFSFFFSRVSRLSSAFFRGRVGVYASLSIMSVYVYLCLHICVNVVCWSSCHRVLY